MAKSGISVNALVRLAIGDAVKRALKSKPIAVHYHVGTDAVESIEGYLIDGEVYMESTAVEKILGEYSWWNEGKH